MSEQFYERLADTTQNHKRYLWVMWKGRADTLNNIDSPDIDKVKLYISEFALKFPLTTDLISILKGSDGQSGVTIGTSGRKLSVIRTKDKIVVEIDGIAYQADQHKNVVLVYRDDHITGDEILEAIDAEPRLAPSVTAAILADADKVVKGGAKCLCGIGHCGPEEFCRMVIGGVKAAKGNLELNTPEALLDDYTLTPINIMPVESDEKEVEVDPNIVDVAETQIEWDDVVGGTLRETWLDWDDAWRDWRPIKVEIPSRGGPSGKSRLEMHGGSTCERFYVSGSGSYKKSGGSKKKKGTSYAQRAGEVFKQYTDAAATELTDSEESLLKELGYIGPRGGGKDKFVRFLEGGYKFMEKYPGERIPDNLAELESVAFNRPARGTFSYSGGYTLLTEGVHDQYIPKRIRERHRPYRPHVYSRIGDYRLHHYNEEQTKKWLERPAYQFDRPEGDHRVKPPHLQADIPRQVEPVLPSSIKGSACDCEVMVSDVNGSACDCEVMVSDVNGSACDCEDEITDTTVPSPLEITDEYHGGNTKSDTGTDSESENDGTIHDDGLEETAEKSSIDETEQFIKGFQQML